MSSVRFFLPDESIDTGQGTVTIAEPAMVCQIKHVLRLAAGDSLTVLDGKGRLYHCLLTKVHSCLVESKIVACEDAPKDPALSVTVALPLLKGERFDWAIQKLTELGVAAVIPTICTHSVVKTKSPGKLLRWQTIMRQAAEQSERGTIPQIVSPVTFVDLVARGLIHGAPCHQLKFLCAERQPVPSLYHVLKSLRASLTTSTDICLFVGPEGGFTHHEIELARSHSCQLVSLGPRVLRSETAAIYALSQVIALADTELSELG